MSCAGSGCPLSLAFGGGVPREGVRVPAVVGPAAARMWSRVGHKYPHTPQHPQHPITVDGAPPPRQFPWGEAGPDWRRQMPLLLCNLPSFPFPAMWDRGTPKPETGSAAIAASPLCNRLPCTTSGGSLCPHPAMAQPRGRHRSGPRCFVQTGVPLPTPPPQKQRPGNGPVRPTLGGTCPAQIWGPDPSVVPPTPARGCSPLSAPPGSHGARELLPGSRKELVLGACRPAGTGGLAAGIQRCPGPLPPQGMSRGPPPTPAWSPRRCPVGVPRCAAPWGATLGGGSGHELTS